MMVSSPDSGSYHSCYRLDVTFLSDGHTCCLLQVVYTIMYKGYSPFFCMSLSTVYLQFSQRLSTHLKLQIMVRLLLPTASMDYGASCRRSL